MEIDFSQMACWVFMPGLLFSIIGGSASVKLSELFMDTVHSQPILMTGASGYLGRKLLPLLVAKGHAVRCLTRKPEWLKPRVTEGVEVVAGDLANKETLLRAMKGIHTAYYLTHSPAYSSHFEEIDRIAAKNFAEAARRNNLKKIIYMGNICENSGRSRFLESREEVGKILRICGVPTLEFQASVILGPGSDAFKMIKAIAERFWVVLAPQWLRTPCQPIALDDVLSYLLAALEKPYLESQVFPIGGPEKAPLVELIREYAEQKRLKRLILPIPSTFRGLSIPLLSLVTRLDRQRVRLLVEGLSEEWVVSDLTAMKIFAVKPMGISESISRAILVEN
jgi:uncharacterized protein YbjT (DUF2867 family)